MDWRPRNCPCLIVGTVALALNNDLLANVQKRQKNINVDIIIG
jgi:hypothetical protein